MTLSTGSATCLYFTNGEKSYTHDYDGSRYDFIILLLSSDEFMYTKVDLDTSSVVWSNLLECVSGSCSGHYATAAISNDKTKAYSLTTLTDDSRTILWLAFEFSDGSIYGSRYMTQTIPDEAKTIVEVGGYVFIIVGLTSGHRCLGRYDADTGKFDVNWYCTSHKYVRIPLGTNPNFDTDPRIYIFGQYGTNG